MGQTLKYKKKCKGCGREFETNGRNAQFAPPEICGCLEKRKKNRNKRARERRKYHRDPESHKALSRTRAEARKLALGIHGTIVKSNRVTLTGTAHRGLRCNSPGCKVTFENELAKARVKYGERDDLELIAVRLLIKKLEAHHRDHDPFNNRIENYPEGSNIELLCRRHHEHSDRAKAGKASLILWQPPTETWFEYLIRLYATDRRRFWLVPASEHYATWSRASQELVA